MRSIGVKTELQAPFTLPAELSKLGNSLVLKRTCPANKRGSSRLELSQRQQKPYIKIVEALPQMRIDGVQLVRQAVGAGRRAYGLVKKLAEGIAPMTVQGLWGCCGARTAGELAQAAMFSCIDSRL